MTTQQICDVNLSNDVWSGKRSDPIHARFQQTQIFVCQYLQVIQILKLNEFDTHTFVPCSAMFHFTAFYHHISTLRYDNRKIDGVLCKYETKQQ